MLKVQKKDAASSQLLFLFDVFSRFSVKNYIWMKEAPVLRLMHGILQLADRDAQKSHFASIKSESNL